MPWKLPRATASTIWSSRNPLASPQICQEQRLSDNGRHQTRAGNGAGTGAEQEERLATQQRCILASASVAGNVAGGRQVRDESRLRKFAQGLWFLPGVRSGQHARWPSAREIRCLPSLRRECPGNTESRRVPDHPGRVHESGCRTSIASSARSPRRMEGMARHCRCWSPPRDGWTERRRPARSSVAHRRRIQPSDLATWLGRVRSRTSILRDVDDQRCAAGSGHLPLMIRPHDTATAINDFFAR